MVDGTVESIVVGDVKVDRRVGRDLEDVVIVEIVGTRL